MRFVTCGGDVFAVDDADHSDCDQCTEITWARYVHEVDVRAARQIAEIRDGRARKLAEATQ